MLTIVPIIVIILSLGVILLIASRHWTQALILDVASLPEEREARLKSTILETRLLRKLNEVWKKMSAVFMPAKNFLTAGYGQLAKRLKGLERAYRFHASSPLPDSSQKSEIKLQDILAQAKSAVGENRLAQAEEQYLSVLKLNPAELEAYEGLGKVYVKRQEWEQARETFDYIIKNWPGHDQAFALLALVEEMAGNLEKAKDLYLHALSINNQAVDYHLNLAGIYQELGDNEKALSSLQKAQALEPNNPKVLDQLLQMSILLGNKSLAEEVLEKIRKVNPEHGKLDELAEKVKALS